MDGYDLHFRKGNMVALKEVIFLGTVLCSYKLNELMNKSIDDSFGFLIASSVQILNEVLFFFLTETLLTRLFL